MQSTFEFNSEELLRQSQRLKEKIVKYKSDIELQVKNLKEQVGLSSPGMSSKNNLYAQNRIMEIVLQYLMVDRIHHKQETAKFGETKESK